MPLLNITKKDESDTSKEVPEELPDLPAEPAEGGESPEAKPAEDANSSGDNSDVESVNKTLDSIKPEASEVVTADNADLAPDELPPVAVAEPETAAQTPEKSKPNVLGKKLYFSNILQTIKEDGVAATKLTASSVDFLHDMKRYWGHQKKEVEVESLEMEIENKLVPLQQLEKEWIALKTDIEQKKAQLKKTETEIQKLSEDIRVLAVKAEKKAGKKK